jgi:hypothetical protein
MVRIIRCQYVWDPEARQGSGEAYIYMAGGS